MKIIKILLITIAIAFSTNSFSDEHKPGVYIRGNVSCGDWVTSRADEDKHWLQSEPILVGRLAF